MGTAGTMIVVLDEEGDDGEDDEEEEEADEVPEEGRGEASQ